ncbi:helix-turn-helix transcriptional regulator [Solihabitans fulvus]|uniref:Helix-turn-helix transcriptional regulator n=1 Tax=Solihabitans fulvus TaxID=1892852 RepID=A0A5B2WRZ7_9PSEU|nr:helix-turn-helix transcriptional regulator [Solihabitans fulvus]KAA2254461.1 helix-turn-helix transcriptional regulator [Solihabitans fulvus]
MSIVNIQQPEFGQRLRALRVERGLSQRDATGGVVNPSYISLLESGARVPTLEVVLQIARALNVPLDALVDDAELPAKGIGGTSPDVRLVLEILGRSSADFGDLADAQVHFAKAYESARRDGVPVSILEHGIALADLLTLRSEGEARYDLLAELATVAENIGVAELIVKVRIDHAAAARDTGRLAEALELAESAAERISATELANTSEHVRTLGVLISIRCDSGDAGDAAHLIDRMLRVAEKIDSRPILGRAHWVACVAYARIGHPELAVRHVRQAREMLATPGTSLREWAKFSRAAASALLDAEAELGEIDQYLTWARAALDMVEAPGEAQLLASLEARYALAAGDPRRALLLSEREPEGLPAAELVRLRLTCGRALHQLGDQDRAMDRLRSAAGLCEELSAYRLAAQIWREIDQLRSANGPTAVSGRASGVA